MKTLKLTALILGSLSLVACQTASLSELTAHLNDRGCATKGSAHASAGITGAQLGGDVSWNCTPKTPAEVVSLAPEF